MTKTEVMKELSANGTAQNRKVCRRHGVRGELFGVSYAALGKLRRRTGRPRGTRTRWAIIAAAAHAAEKGYDKNNEKLLHGCLLLSVGVQNTSQPYRRQPFLVSNRETAVTFCLRKQTVVR